MKFEPEFFRDVCQHGIGRKPRSAFERTREGIGQPETTSELNATLLAARLNDEITQNVARLETLLRCFFHGDLLYELNAAPHASRYLDAALSTAVG